VLFSVVFEERCVTEIKCFHATVMGTAEDSSQVSSICLKLPLKLCMQIGPCPQVQYNYTADFVKTLCSMQVRAKSCFR